MKGYDLRRAFPSAQERWRPDLDYLCRFLNEAWGIRRVGTTSDGSPIIADATTPAGGQWWVIADNGGELNLCRINGESSSVPYEQRGALVPIGRLASFCSCVLSGKIIDDYASSPLDDVTLDDLRGVA